MDSRYTADDVSRRTGEKDRFLNLNPDVSSSDDSESGFRKGKTRSGKRSRKHNHKEN